jgi:hypothetical protein
MTIQSRYSRQYTDNFDKVFMCEHTDRRYSFEQFGHIGKFSVQCERCGKTASVERKCKKLTTKISDECCDALAAKLVTE